MYDCGPNADFDKYEKHTCVFDSEHKIDAFRWTKHIQKCSQNYPDIKIARCKFNGRHIIRLDRGTLDEHHLFCPDKRVIDQDLNPHVPRVSGNLNFPPVNNSHNGLDPSFFRSADDWRKFERADRPSEPYMIKGLQGPKAMKNVVYNSGQVPGPIQRNEEEKRPAAPHAIGRAKPGRGRGRGHTLSQGPSSDVTSTAMESMPLVGRARANYGLQSGQHYPICPGTTDARNSNEQSTSAMGVCDSDDDSDEEYYNQLATKLILGRGKPPRPQF
ncbi:uncharacterized protein LOC142345397 isoform X2 [Convolutriloba macropyga]|uniref:uncharacterized protein LOC142345397 isoform X2 n=1 Tax=Convolutriloba macropyga TaxID=536237 RepID=UPI003F51EDE2